MDINDIGIKESRVEESSPEEEKGTISNLVLNKTEIEHDRLLQETDVSLSQISFVKITDCEWKRTK